MEVFVTFEVWWMNKVWVWFFDKVCLFIFCCLDIRPELGRELMHSGGWPGAGWEEEKLRRGKISQPEILEQQVRLGGGGRRKLSVGWLEGGQWGVSRGYRETWRHGPRSGQCLRFWAWERGRSGVIADRGTITVLWHCISQDAYHELNTCNMRPKMWP